MTRRVLRTVEAAEYLGLSPRTLEKLRADGSGPRWLRLTERRAVGYDLADLDAWLETRRSEAGHGAAHRPDPDAPVVG